MINYGVDNSLTKLFLSIECRSSDVELKIEESEGFKVLDYKTKNNQGEFSWFCRNSRVESSYLSVKKKGSDRLAHYLYFDFFKKIALNEETKINGVIMWDNILEREPGEPADLERKIGEKPVGNGGRQSQLLSLNYCLSFDPVLDLKNFKEKILTDDEVTEKDLIKPMCFNNISLWNPTKQAVKIYELINKARERVLEMIGSKTFSIEAYEIVYEGTISKIKDERRSLKSELEQKFKESVNKMPEELRNLPWIREIGNLIDDFNPEIAGIPMPKPEKLKNLQIQPYIEKEFPQLS